MTAARPLNAAPRRAPHPIQRLARCAGALGLAASLALAHAAEAEAPAASSLPAEAFKPTGFTGSDAHKYLGLGTVVLLGLTAATAPHESCKGADCTRQTSGTTHTRLARTTAFMAGATVGTGLVVHWDDFRLRDGFSDPDNQHVLLGLVGSSLLLWAVNRSIGSSVRTEHGGVAEVGGLAMAVAIKLTW